MLPEGARDWLLEVVTSAWDRLVVTWLTDGGFRIGELCGLHLADLHLRHGARCGQCRWPHVHVCHRPGNPNRAAAKTKLAWSVEDGTVVGGLVRRASPAMVRAYFEYMTGEYRQSGAGHGMLLVQLNGPGRGMPWTSDGARRMLRRAGARAGMGLVRPHAFRHSFATSVLDASGGDLVVTREAGGWASASTVEEIYAHADAHDPVFDRALREVWGSRYERRAGGTGRVGRRGGSVQELAARRMSWWSVGTATCRRVVFGGDAGGGLFTEAYVPSGAGRFCVTRQRWTTEGAQSPHAE